METTNSTPQETTPAPVASTPEAPAAAAPAAAPAPKPAAVPFTGEIPKTDGKTPGGWNRFAGYNPNDAKNKKNDRRDNKGRR